MSNDAMPSLQFDRAELGAQKTNNLACNACGREVVQSYYTIGRTLVCSECRDRYEQGTGQGSAFGRFFRAAGAATGAALAGALVWWAVRTFVEYELAIIAIGIGFGVARGIQWGTHGQTNTFYRLLAVLITYFGIAMNYVPDLAKSAAEGHAIRLVHVIVAFITSFAVPVLSAGESPILILIIAFGLWNAWKHTAPTRLEAQGPFSVAPAAVNV